eukprot:gene14375-17001_t
MIDFLLTDDRARAAYMFFRLLMVAGVEHYWSSLFTLSELQSRTTNKVPCFMIWQGGRGANGIHNAYMTLNEWPLIENYIKMGTPFARKFDSVRDRAVLDTIDNRTMYQHMFRVIFKKSDLRRHSGLASLRTLK